MNVRVLLVVGILSLFCVFVMGKRAEMPSFDVNRELGYFSKCKGKSISYPPKLVADGAIHIFHCQATLDFIKASNKFCVGLCVSQKYGYMYRNMTYNWDAASKPLFEEAKLGTMDKEIVEIQTAALKRCGAHGRVYSLDDDCEEAQKFDECIRTAQQTDCGPVNDD